METDDVYSFRDIGTEEKNEKIKSIDLLDHSAGVSYAGGILLNIVLGKKSFKITENPEIFTEGSTMLYSFLVLMIIGILWLTRVMNRIGKIKPNSSSDQYFNSHFIPIREMKKNKKYNYSKFSNLRTMKDGIVIRSEKKGKDIEVNMYKPIHTMIIGSTGSGKTQCYVNPSIQILAHCKTKPSMVISDPKGELYTFHSKMLLAQGYELKVLDLREPYSSARWNPLDRAYRLYHRAQKLEEEIIVRKGVNPADLKLKITSKEYGQEWYEFNGNAYATKSLLENDLRTKRQELEGMAYEELTDIASVLCPIESKNDPTWDMGARSFVNGILIAMLEDSINPDLKMKRENFIFYNVNKIASYRDADPDNKLETMRNYFYGRPKLSKALEMANTVVNNSPKTADNYLGIVNTRLKLFQDTSMCFLTSATDIDFTTIADKPTAFFIKIPDEKEVRHPIATICISQLYKTLVEVAGNRGGELPRNVHFILDEFANLPKIENLATIITVARSRKIFFHLVIQSYSQLAIKYGEEVADTLRSNCNIHVYIGTTDQKTKEEFSKRCGDRTVTTYSSSESKTSGQDGMQRSKSTQVNTRPLVYPAELEHLGKDTFIVSIMNEFPMKVVYTPSWQCQNIFEMEKMPEKYAPTKFLDEDKIYYDIAERNQIIFNSGATKKNNLFDDLF